MINNVLCIASGPIGQYMDSVPKHVEEARKFGPEQNSWELQMVGELVEEVKLGLKLVMINNVLFIASGLIGQYMDIVPKHVEKAFKLWWEQKSWVLQMVGDPVKEVKLHPKLATFGAVLWIASGLFGLK